MSHRRLNSLIAPGIAVAVALFVFQAVVQLTHTPSGESTLEGVLEHVNILSLTVTLLAMAPAVVAIGRQAGAPRATRVALTGMAALARTVRLVGGPQRRLRVLPGGGHPGQPDVVRRLHRASAPRSSAPAWSSAATPSRCHWCGSCCCRSPPWAARWWPRPCGSPATHRLGLLAGVVAEPVPARA